MSYVSMDEKIADLAKRVPQPGETCPPKPRREQRPTKVPQPRTEPAEEPQEYTPDPQVYLTWLGKQQALNSMFAAFTDPARCRGTA